MNFERKKLVEDANAWLQQQPTAEPQSGRWYALGNFKRFVADLEESGTAESIDKAAWALGRFISDQYDWSADYCQPISSFLARARRLGKAVRNG